MMNARWIKFASVVIVIGVVWGGVLPQLAKTQTVRQRNRWLDERGIDPAAMYYTDLPMMDPILERIER